MLHLDLLGNIEQHTTALRSTRGLVVYVRGHVLDSSDQGALVRQNLMIDCLGDHSA